MNYWLIELCQSGLITKPDYEKIMHWLRLWHNGRLIPHLAEFILFQDKFMSSVVIGAVKE